MVDKEINKHHEKISKIIRLTKFVVDIEGAVLDRPVSVVKAETPTFGASNNNGSLLITDSQRHRGS